MMTTVIRTFWSSRSLWVIILSQKKDCPNDDVLLNTNRAKFLWIISCPVINVRLHEQSSKNQFAWSIDSIAWLSSKYSQKSVSKVERTPWAQNSSRLKNICSTTRTYDNEAISLCRRSHLGSCVSPQGDTWRNKEIDEGKSRKYVAVDCFSNQALASTHTLLTACSTSC